MIFCRAEGGEAVEQADQTHGGEHHREQVEPAALEVIVVRKNTQRNGHDRKGQSRHDDEDRTPTHEVDQETGQGRADCRRKADEQADNTHGATALLTRKDEQDGAHDHRHDSAGACRLDHTACQEHVEVGRQGSHDAADAKEGDSADVELACRQPAHQISGKRDDYRLGKRVARGKPLDRGGGDVHLTHNRREGRSEQRRVEHGDKGARKQNHDHRELFFSDAKTHTHQFPSRKTKHVKKTCPRPCRSQARGL